ncbi:MAG: hypothetical protein IJ302_05015 [Clostridia bacterium]|nr:hypothetical protein [Clostridia bacterium]
MKPNFLLLPWIALLSALLLSCSAAPVQQTESDTDSPVLTSALTDPAQTTADIPTDTTAETMPSVPVYTEEEIRRIVDENLDILTAFTPADDAWGYQDIIDANPEAFDALTALGEDADAYLLECGQNPETDNAPPAYYRREMALWAAYTINPALFDLAFPSPDGTHTVKMEVAGFFGNLNQAKRNGTAFYGSVRMEETATGRILTQCSSSVWMPTVTWSEDNTSACISVGEDFVICLNPTRPESSRLPDQTVLSLLPAASDAGALRADTARTHFLAFTEDGSVRIEITANYGDFFAPDVLTGTFLYAADGTVPDLTYEILPPDSESIARGIENYLPLIPSPSIYGYENDYSSQYGLDKIVEIGEAALPHLTHIAESTRKYDSAEYDHSKFLTAMFAATLIDPGAFPELIPSQKQSYVYFEQEDLIFDRVGRRILCCSFLPFGDMLTAAYGIPVYRENTDLELISWESDTVIRLGFFVHTGESDIGTITGECTYDFSADTMLSIEYTTEFEPNPGPTPYDDISRDIAAQLDLLLQNAENAYSEQDCIDACPEAFDAILAHSEAALPYLTDVVENTPTRYYMRISLAQMAAHRISPALYAADTASPDGQYRIRLLPESFVGQFRYDIGISYGSACLLDASSDAAIAEINTYLISPEVAWSSDSR